MYFKRLLVKRIGSKQTIFLKGNEFSDIPILASPTTS